MAVPGHWETLRARAAALIATREAVLAETAEAWIRFARAQGWARHDVECLWDGLTEDLVRRMARDRAETAATVRGDVLAVMQTLRTRILAALSGPGVER